MTNRDLIKYLMDYPLDAQVHLNLDATLQDNNVYAVETNSFGDIYISNSTICPLI